MKDTLRIRKLGKPPRFLRAFRSSNLIKRGSTDLITRTACYAFLETSPWHGSRCRAFANITTRQCVGGRCRRILVHLRKPRTKVDPWFNEEGRKSAVRSGVMTRPATSICEYRSSLDGSDQQPVCEGTNGSGIFLQEFPIARRRRTRQAAQL